MRVMSRSSHRPWNWREPLSERPSQRRACVYQVTADTCKSLCKDLSVHDELLQAAVHCSPAIDTLQFDASYRQKLSEIALTIRTIPHILFFLFSNKNLPIFPLKSHY